MTNKSLSWKEWNKPILLRPAGKDYLWGGNRLKTEYHKNIPLTPLAETWECSTHPDGPSVIAGGDFAGRTLPEVLRLHPEWLGNHHQRDEGLPVLIKLIDAGKDLSVQVHPDDTYALEKEGQPGKTEMWYVLDAEPGASLIFGFAQDMTGEKILQSLEEGRFMEYLQKVPVRKNDVFFIEPGTIHAIGGGVLVAEIQECSNVTYRVYDYDRLDKDGNPRKLHLQQALEVLKLNQEPEVRQQMRVMRYQPGSACECLCRCRYFQVDRILVSSRFVCKVEVTSFQVLLVLEGELEVRKRFEVYEQAPRKVACAEKEQGALEDMQELEILHVQKGDCVFLPADCGEIEVHGRGQLLRVFC